MHAYYLLSNTVSRQTETKRASRRRIYDGGEKLLPVWRLHESIFFSSARCAARLINGLTRFCEEGRKKRTKMSVRFFPLSLWRERSHATTPVSFNFLKIRLLLARIGKGGEEGGKGRSGVTYLLTPASVISHCHEIARAGGEEEKRRRRNEGKESQVKPIFTEQFHGITWPVRARLLALVCCLHCFLAGKERERES